MTLLNATLKAVSKPLSAAPGWAPLLVASYALVDAGLSEMLEQRFGLVLSLPDPVWALALTLTFYPIGDWIDEWVFYRRFKTKQNKKRVKCHRFNPGWVTNPREGIRRTLMIRVGTYRVGKALARASDCWRWPSIVNETAKFLRSLPVPFVFAALTAVGATTTVARLSIAGLGVGMLPAYVLLKLWHIRLLYLRVRTLATGPEGLSVSDAFDTRAFFWQGELVTTADPRRQDPCEPQDGG